MTAKTSRIIIKTFVRTALKDADESPERCTRNLVDMALHFSKGRFQQEFFEGFLRMSCRIADLNSQRHTVSEMVVKLRRGIVRNDPDLPDSAQNAEINQKTEIRFVAEPQQVRRIIREKFPDPLRAGLWTIQDCFHSIPFQ